jgi:two-component system response regulator RegA
MSSRRSSVDRPDARAIILTGYGNIATAVNAVKLGAVDYLASRSTPTTSRRRCSHSGARGAAGESDVGRSRVRWEHIQRIYELCGRNVSETARRLNMHRRTAAHPGKRAPK